MEGVNTFTDVDKLKEILKIEQFITSLPVDIHKWVLERHPVSLMEAVKLADEYSILTRPFKMNSSLVANLRNSGEMNDNWRKPYSNFGPPPTVS